MNILRGIKFFLLAASVLLPVARLAAQQPKVVSAPPPAPLPAQIVAAKTVFISNAGGDCNPFGTDGYTGGPDRSYNEFYSAMNAWGRFELVKAPGSADLIFEIHFTCPVYFDGKLSRLDPQLRLIILDPGTRVMLWAFTEHFDAAILQGNRDKNYETGMEVLVNDVKRLVTRPDAVLASQKK